MIVSGEIHWYQKLQNLQDDFWFNYECTFVVYSLVCNACWIISLYAILVPCKQDCGAVLKMTLLRLRLRTSFFHEHGSCCSSGALGFHKFSSGSGALFFHKSALHKIRLRIYDPAYGQRQSSHKLRWPYLVNFIGFDRLPAYLKLF